MNPTAPGKEWHFATIFELIADVIPDRLALAQGRARRSWREFDDRAARLSAAMQGFGIGHDGKVALYLHNCPEYKEAQYAAFKARGVVVNVNYRYVEDELVYLLDNSDTELLVFHRKFADRVAAIRSRLPRVRSYIQVDDGSGADLAGACEYEDLIRTTAPAARIHRAPTDTLMNYTGGTTGMPKGVLYEHEAAARLYTFGYDFYDLPAPQTVEDLVTAVRDLAAAGRAPVSLVCAPFMHGAGNSVGHLVPAMMGGAVHMLEKTSFDAHEALGLVERERATQMVIVGDAIAKPLVAALDERAQAGAPYDISSLRLIASSGVMWTREVKARLLEYQDMKLVDSLGATEGGYGSAISSRSVEPHTARFKARPGTMLLGDDGQWAPWGSGRSGRIAVSTNIPKGYYKDPEKTAQIFPVIDGVRYSVPGDYATIDADGSITLLGRGSGCINTGGEKVFAEEVEEALKRHEAVYDCLVVGVPDDRMGSSVAAVVSLSPGRTTSLEELQAFARTQLSGYKIPRRVTFVDEVRRSPNGKPDYRWAKEAAEAAAS